MLLFTDRRSTAAAVIAAIALTGACSQGTRPDTSTTVSTPGVALDTPTELNTAALQVTEDDCVNASGHLLARRGNLSVGPFLPAALSAEPAAAKVWVASQRDGHDDAALTILRPDGTTQRQIRRSGEASISDAKQFYPGTIELRGPGAYRIAVHAGPDQLCVIADYS